MPKTKDELFDRMYDCIECLDFCLKLANDAEIRLTPDTIDYIHDIIKDCDEARIMPESRRSHIATMKKWRE